MRVIQLTDEITKHQEWTPQERIEAVMKGLHELCEAFNVIITPEVANEYDIVYIDIDDASGPVYFTGINAIAPSGLSLLEGAGWRGSGE